MNPLLQWHAVADVAVSNPLDRKDIAATWQRHMDTRSIMYLASCSRGTYHAYRPQLDKRIVALFGLAPRDSSHKAVMEALAAQIPAGETAHVVSICNRLLNEYGDLVASKLFKYFDLSEKKFVFEIMEPTKGNSLELREGLLTLALRLWPYVSFYTRLSLENDPSFLRFLGVIGAHSSIPTIKRLEGTACAGLLLANDPTVPAYMERWAKMNPQQQAAFILEMGRRFARVTRVDDADVLFVKNFLEATTNWRSESMRRCCSDIVSRHLTQNDGVLYLRVYLFVDLLRKLASASREPVQRAIFDMMQKMCEATTTEEIQHIQEAFLEAIYRAEIESSAPSFEAIAYMVCRYPEEEKVKEAFSNFRKSWKDLSCKAQAEAVYALAAEAYRYGIRDPESPAGRLLVDFAEADLLGWKSRSMQRAAALLVRNHATEQKGPAIVTMVEMLKDPAYVDYQDTLCRYLGELLEAPSSETVVSWQNFLEELLAIKLKEVSLLVRPDLQTVTEQLKSTTL